MEGPRHAFDFLGKCRKSWLGLKMSSTEVRTSCSFWWATMELQIAMLLFMTTWMRAINATSSFQRYIPPLSDSIVAVKKESKTIFLPLLGLCSTKRFRSARKDWLKIAKMLLYQVHNKDCQFFPFFEGYIWKVWPKHTSRVYWRRLKCPRQPVAGWRDANFLAVVLIHQAGKVFSLSADSIFVSRFCQQICLLSADSVSRFLK